LPCGSSEGAGGSGHAEAYDHDGARHSKLAMSVEMMMGLLRRRRKRRSKESRSAGGNILGKSLTRSRAKHQEYEKLSRGQEGK